MVSVSLLIMLSVSCLSGSCCFVGDKGAVSGGKEEGLRIVQCLYCSLGAGLVSKSQGEEGVWEVLKSDFAHDCLL